jgi:hypothetical protein
MTLKLAFVLPLILSMTTALAAAPTLVSKHKLKIDKSKPYPSVVFSDILLSMQDQVVYKKGQLRIFKAVRFTFLPDFKDPKHIAAYNINTGAKLYHQIHDGKGKLLRTVFWQVQQQKFPFWVGSPVNNHNPPALKSGRYTLTFGVEGQPFWRMAFEVKGAKGADAYEKPKVYLDGPWRDYVYLYIGRGNLEGGATLSLFLRDKRSKIGKWKDAKVKITIKRGGRLVGENSGLATFRLRPWYVRYDLPMRKGRTFAKAKDLVKRGRYTVTVKVNGKRWGVFKYKAAGKIPLSSRKKTKPFDFLEGGRDRFYIKRVR